MPLEIIYNPHFRLIFVRFQPAITAAQLNEVVGCGYENLMQINAETFSDWMLLAKDTGYVGLQSGWCIWRRTTGKAERYWHIRFPGNVEATKVAAEKIQKSNLMPSQMLYSWKLKEIFVSFPTAITAEASQRK